MRDPSFVCDLHHSSRQRWILRPLSEARDRTRNLMVPRRIHFHCTATGTPGNSHLNPSLDVTSSEVSPPLPRPWGPPRDTFPVLPFHPALWQFGYMDAQLLEPQAVSWRRGRPRPSQGGGSISEDVSAPEPVPRAQRQGRRGGARGHWAKSLALPLTGGTLSRRLSPAGLQRPQ